MTGFFEIWELARARSVCWGMGSERTLERWAVPLDLRLMRWCHVVLMMRFHFADKSLTHVLFTFVTLIFFLKIVSTQSLVKKKYIYVLILFFIPFILNILFFFCWALLFQRYLFFFFIFLLCICLRLLIIFGLGGESLVFPSIHLCFNSLGGKYNYILFIKFHVTALLKNIYIWFFF